MNYEEFKENIVQDIKDAFADKGLAVEAEIRQCEKLNESYDAMTVRPESGCIGVNINLNQLFDSYSKGQTYQECVDTAADMADKSLNNVPDFDVDMMNDYEQMKSKLSMEVVSADRNAELLEKVPHKNMEDLAVVYRFVLGEYDGGGRSTILITNDLLDKYGITPEQLHKDAMEMAPELRPAVIKGMTEVMVEMMGVDNAEMMGMVPDPENEAMYVATTPDKVQGAGVLAYQDFMDQAAERLGGDFYILPSSIHEILLVKDNGQFDRATLENMVREVNETQVSPQDKLTDSVYHYDSKEHVFELAAKFEAREKEAEKEEVLPEKGSVLAELKAKKDEVARQSKKDNIEKDVKSKDETSL